MSELVAHELASPASTERRPRSRALRIARALVSVGVAVVIFALVIPKIASHSTGWSSLSQLSITQLPVVVGAMLFNLLSTGGRCKPPCRG